MRRRPTRSRRPDVQTYGALWLCCRDRQKAELALSGCRLGDPDGGGLCRSDHRVQHRDGDGDLAPLRRQAPGGVAQGSTREACGMATEGRSLGPIRCLYRAIAVSAWFLLPYPVAFCHPPLPFHALTRAEPRAAAPMRPRSAMSRMWRSRWLWTPSSSSFELGTADARGGTTTSSGGWRWRAQPLRRWARRRRRRPPSQT